MTNTTHPLAGLVAPLEWVPIGDGIKWGNGVFNYKVREAGNGFWTWCRNGQEGTHYLPDEQGEQAAMDAAQADYERRILSALVIGESE